MTTEQTASRLIASAILQCIKESNIRFGLLARNLPRFNSITLCDTFKPALTQQELLLGLLGSENSQIGEFPQVATAVEQVVAWRNILVSIYLSL